MKDQGLQSSRVVLVVTLDDLPVAPETMLERFWTAASANCWGAVSALGQRADLAARLEAVARTAPQRLHYPEDVVAAIRSWREVGGRAVLVALIKAIADSGRGSFLSVLKRMGSEHGPFSVPPEGYTLALGFPFSGKTAALMDRLDAIALDHGGRFYLAKDARMSAATLTRSDPRARAFAAMRAGAGLGQFRSSQSERPVL